MLAEERHRPQPFWAPWAGRVERAEIRVEVGGQRQDWLREGEATLIVTAERPATLLHRPEPVIERLTLPVRLYPPTLEVVSTGVHVAQGGAEVVVYRVGPTSVRDGVRAGEWWFRGYDLPGGEPGERFALFGVPYDLDDREQIRLIAEDEVGNQASRSFVDVFFEKPLKTDTIQLSDGFLQKVVPAILAITPDLEPGPSLLESYLRINGELRARNARELVALAQRSTPAFLWSQVFLQMPNTKVMSAFADRRTYLYDGKPVDQQDHLGFDLASTRRAPVPAANDGIVLLARPFGIYGNTVVVDHGYGLMSLYGHLSGIEVSEGMRVERGQILGRSGDTGLAGGDHLHFTMLVQGLPVNPIEWWDPHWIRDRLKTKLGDALPFSG